MDIKRFSKWLVEQGAEILPITNEYEALRFRCAQGVGVVYRNRKGAFSVSGPLVSFAYDCMKGCKAWSGKGRPVKRRQGSAKKQQLLDRDGWLCFYCGEPLEEDATIEHLVAVNQGGPDRLENMVLAHFACNQGAGSLPVIEKVRIRERMLALAASD